MLDGCAHAPEVESTRLLAAAEEVTCRVVVTRCRDVELHRARLDRRTRNIPGWYELDWAHVADFLSRWDEPPGADLALDAADPLPANLTRLSELLAPGRRRRQHR